MSTRSSAASNSGCRRARSAVVLNRGSCMQSPRENSARRFMDQVRALTRRRVRRSSMKASGSSNNASPGLG